MGFAKGEKNWADVIPLSKIDLILNRAEGVDSNGKDWDTNAYENIHTDKS